MYSTDGINWNATNGLKIIIGMELFGGGKFVAVAESETTVMYSADGAN